MFKINAMTAAIGATTLALGAVATGAVAAPTRFTFVDLGVGTSADAINSKNAVAGSSGDGFGNAPAIYANGSWHRLNGSDSPGTQAFALNKSEDSVYWLVDPISPIFNYYQPRNGALVYLAGWTQVTGISDDRVVIGVKSAGRLASACVAYKNGVTQTIQAGGDRCSANGINSAHQVVGEANATAGATGQAFLWENGVFKFLTDASGPESFATAINASGHVAIAQNSSAGIPMFYDGTTTVALPLPAGTTSAAPFAINKHDDMVGTSFTSSTNTYGAFLISRGLSYDLATLTDGIPDGFAFTFNAATGINDSGVIVGNGTIGFDQHGFMLVPVQ